MISETASDWKLQKRKIDASPQREDFEREFGKHRVKDEPDGSWSLTLKDRKDIKKAHQMQEDSRRAEIELGDAVQSRMRRERVIRRDGRVLDFPEELIDTVKHRFRTTGRNGLAPAEHFSLAEAFGKYEQGPDGLWFVWNDGWEPTSLWRNGVVSPQRDPEGNRWVERNKEWFLEDEVA